MHIILYNRKFENSEIETDDLINNQRMPYGRGATIAPVTYGALAVQI
jgi:hypothetical protein